MNIEEEAIALVREEKTLWADATAFITDSVAFQMRTLIKKLRKNYYGVFEEPIDPTTGRKKIWIPLTESLVEATVKNIDLDTKDIGFMAKKTSAIGRTSVVRSLTQNYLDNSFFGELLDDAERRMSIDGTVVWKTVEREKDGKIVVDTSIVDLLNFYIDPTASSIQETEAVIERSVISIKEYQSMDWINTEDVVGEEDLNSNDEDTTGIKKTPMVEVFERWGLMPKSLITGEVKDTELIDGRIVCSDCGGNWRVNLIEKTNGLKPYEEAWFTRVPNRWYGRGPAEKLLMLQLWLNIVVNVRINRAYFAQLGIFKIKNNSGISTESISRLATNGTIMVNNMDDVEQLVMKEASQASYNDENVIQGWAERVTSAFESVTGESMPASTPATNAMIQSRAAQSSFGLVKEDFSLFLQRWLKRHSIPIIMKNITDGEIVRVTGKEKDIEEMDKMIADALIYKAIKKSKKLYSPMQIEEERKRILFKLRKQGLNRYVKIKNSIDITEYDVKIVITNENIDKGILTQNLIQMLSLVPEGRIEISKQLMDIMGLDGNILPDQEQMLKMQQAQQAQEGGASEQEIMTQANTPTITSGSNVKQ